MRKVAIQRSHGWFGGAIHEDVCPTIDRCIDYQHIVIGEIMEEKIRIRKLTPKECFALMAFSSEDFKKAEQVNSSSQLYKQAGNSICVNVLEQILEPIVK